MEMPHLSDAHRRMNVLVGHWSGDEKLSPSPWDPVGGSAVGKSDNRSILDGFAVAHDYEQLRDGQVTFRGHGVFTWNGQENAYYLHWFDSMAAVVNVFRGQFDGKIFTFDSVDQGMKSRVIFDFSRPNSYIFRMEITQDGNQWMTFMEGNYRRTATVAKAGSAKPRAKAKPKKTTARSKRPKAKVNRPSGKLSKKKTRRS